MWMTRMTSSKTGTSAADTVAVVGRLDSGAVNPEATVASGDGDGNNCSASRVPLARTAKAVAVWGPGSGSWYDPGRGSWHRAYTGKVARTLSSEYERCG